MDIRSRFSHMNILKNINNKHSSLGNNIDALDGIRALAVLLVIVSHTAAFKLGGQGAIGVWLFFVLSGFLLTLPFAKNPERANSIIGMAEFLLRRLKRIVPMFYVTIIIFYLFLPGFFKDSKEYANHFIFYVCNGHLWSTQQEVVFYIFLPGILYLNYLLYKKFKANNLMISFILLLWAAFLNKYLTSSIFYLHGNSANMKFSISIFLVGMALAYFYNSPTFGKIAGNKYSKSIINVLGFCVIIIYFFSSKYFKDKLGILPNVDYVGWSYPLTFALLNSLLILSVLANKGGLLDRIFSTKILRSIGVVSYSMYLLHFLFLHYLPRYVHHNYSLFFSVTIITYLVSCVTYYFIERPFINIKVSLKKKTPYKNSSKIAS